MSSRTRFIKQLLINNYWKDAFPRLVEDESLYENDQIKFYYPNRTAPEKQCHFAGNKYDTTDEKDLAFIALMNMKKGDIVPYATLNEKTKEYHEYNLVFEKYTNNTIVFMNGDKKTTFNFNGKKFEDLIEDVGQWIRIYCVGHSNRNIGSVIEMLERDESVFADNETHFYRVENAFEFELRTVLQKVLKYPLILPSKHLKERGKILKSIYKGRTSFYEDCLITQ